ncbi:MAG: GntR family transcriptional regulator [Blastocatellia bacterium]
MKNSGLRLIQPISKRDQVVASIREAILAGTLQPGEAIVESRIAGQLGAGTPLVREALIELEHQGYVRKVPYKGTTVTKLEREDVDNIFRLRAELEALAVEWAREHITPDDMTQLRTLIEQMKQAAQQLDLARFYEADLAFHRRLWELSGNPYLVETLERLVVPLFAFFVMKVTRKRKSYVESAAGHEKLIDALATMSAPALRRLMKDSLAGWNTEMLDLLPLDA